MITPKFWIVMSILTVALAAIVYFTQAVEPLPADLSKDSAPLEGPVLHVGSFTVGPDDEEPVLTGVLRIRLEDMFQAGQAASDLQGTRSTNLTFHVGSHPGPEVPKKDAVPVDAFSISGTSSRHDDDSFELKWTFTRSGSWGGGGGRFRPGEVFAVDGPGCSTTNGRWTLRFALGRVEPTDGPSDLETWRSAIVRTCADLSFRRNYPHENGAAGSQALWSGLRAASWIPCPAARGVLSSLTGSLGKRDVHDPEVPLSEKYLEKNDLQVARMMAGDAEAAGEQPFPVSGYQAWPARTIHLQQEKMRDAVRPVLQSFIGGYPPGPKLAARLKQDPALSVDGIVSSSGSEGSERLAAAFIVFVLIVMGFMRNRDLAGSLSAIALACLLSFVGITIEGVNLVRLVGLAILAGGTLALTRAPESRSPAARIALIGVLALVGIQAGMLAGVPGAVSKAGDAVDDGLPLLLLLAATPLVGAAATGALRTLKVFVVSTLVPTIALLLVSGMNALRPPAGTPSTADAVGWIFVVFGVIALFTGPIGWWKLRKALLGRVTNPPLTG